MGDSNSEGPGSASGRTDRLEELSEELTSGKNLEELARAVGASCYQQGLAHGFLRAAQRLKEAAVEAFLGGEGGASVLREAFLDVFGRGREKRDEHRRRWKGRREKALQEIARRQRLIEDLVHAVAAESDQLDEEAVAAWQQGRTLFRDGPAYEVPDLQPEISAPQTEDEAPQRRHGTASPESTESGHDDPETQAEEVGPGGDGRSAENPPEALTVQRKSEIPNGDSGESGGPETTPDSEEPMSDVAAAVKVLKDVCSSGEKTEDTRSVGSQNRPASD